MAKKNEFAKIFAVAVPLAAVVLLAKTVSAGGNNTYAPGELVASGEKKAGNGQLFEWRIVGSAPGYSTAEALTGQAKLAGFGSWDVESVVAFGANPGQAQTNIYTYLSGLA